MAVHTPAERFRIRLSIAALVTYLVLVLITTLAIRPVDGAISDEIAAMLARLRAQGLPFFITYTSVESVANVVLFLPLGALVALALHVRRWWISPLAALLLSLLIEGAQLLFLPERVATWTDVAANTLGALIGAAAALLLRLLVRRRDRLLGQGPGSR